MNANAPTPKPSDKTVQLDPKAFVSPSPPQIPDHELLRRVGEGAYGEVWLARNVMGTYRAVKIVYRRSFSDDRPYEREFAGIKKFEPISRAHGSQVDILHVGRNDKEGYFYYVMELADDSSAECGVQSAELADNAPGSIPHSELRTPDSYVPRTLKLDLTRRGRLPFDECLDLALALTTALEHLHQNGLMHRDIKPANIIFVNGQPKLADIGLVTELDATKSFVGTEGYIPPEGPTTPQADIYSLGKVLYEAATGRDRQDFPELPTDLGVAAEQEGLVELNEVILKACASDTKHRYPNATEMHADLLLLKTGKSVKHTRGLERRLKLLTRVGVVAVPVLALTLGAFFYQKQQARRALEISQKEQRLRQEAETQRQKAMAAEKTARTEASKHEQVATFLKDMLKGVEPSVALGRDSTMLREILDKTAERVGRDLKDQPDVEADVRETLAGAYWELALYAQAEAMQRETLRLRKSVFGSEDQRVASALGRLGGVLLEQGKLAEAETLIREALAILQKLLGNGHADVARSLSHLAGLLMKQGNPSEAEARFREALAIQKRLPDDADSELASTVNNLAALLAQEGKLAEAETLFRETLAAQKQRSRESHPDYALSLANLGAVLAKQGKMSEAEQPTREALAMRKKLFGVEHPYVAQSLGNVSASLADQGRLAEAESMRREALGILKKVYGGEHTDVADALENLAMLLQREGKLEEAEASQREALAMRRKLLGNEHPDVAEALGNLAVLLQREGKLQEAEATQREALAMRRKLLGNEHPDVASSLVSFASVLGEQGKLPEAEAMAREALAIQRKRLGNENVDSIATLNTLASILKEQRKLGEAEAALRESLALARKLLGEAHPEVVARLTTLSSWMYERGDSAAAEAMVRETLATQRALVGPDHRNVAMALGVLAHELRGQGKLAEAEASASEALAIWKKRPGDEPPDAEAARAALMILSEAARVQGRLPEAEAAVREALAMTEKLRPGDHLSCSGLLTVLSLMQQSQGKLTEAETSEREALAVSRSLPKQESVVAAQLCFLADLQARRGNTTNAEALLGEALALQTKSLSSDRPDVATTLKDLAAVLEKQGRRADAEAAARQAVAIQKRLTSKASLAAPPGFGASATNIFFPAGLVAVVDGRPIFDSEVRKQMGDLEELLRRQFLTNNPAEFAWRLEQARHDALEQLVERECIFSAFKREGRKLDTDAVRSVFNEDARSTYGDAKTLSKALAAEGITGQEYWERREQDIAVASMQTFGDPAAPARADEQIESYYQTHLGQFSVGDQRAAHTKPLEEVREEIRRILMAQQHAAWLRGLRDKAFIGYFGVPTGGTNLAPAPVLSIEIQHVGPVTSSDEQLRAKLRIKAGERLTRAAVDRELRGLYGSGDWYNLRMLGEPVGGGIKLIYVLQERPVLSEIRFTGNKRFSSSALLEGLASKMGGRLDEWKLFADSRQLQKLYQEAGYQKATVKYVVNIDEPTSRGSVTFEITESSE